MVNLFTEINYFSLYSSGSSGGAKFTDEIDLDEDIDKTLHIKVVQGVLRLLQKLINNNSLIWVSAQGSFSDPKFSSYQICNPFATITVSTQIVRRRGIKI